MSAALPGASAALQEASALPEARRQSVLPGHRHPDHSPTAAAGAPSPEAPLLPEVPFQGAVPSEAALPLPSGAALPHRPAGPLHTGVHPTGPPHHQATVHLLQAGLPPAAVLIPAAAAGPTPAAAAVLIPAESVHRPEAVAVHIPEAAAVHIPAGVVADTTTPAVHVHTDSL